MRPIVPIWPLAAHAAKHLLDLPLPVRRHWEFIGRVALPRKLALEKAEGYQR
jgi:hypothetical protein